MTTVVRPGRADSLVEVASSAQAFGRPRRRERRPYIALNGAAMMAIAVVAIGIIGILYLIQTSQVAGLGYQLSHQQTRHDELALENSRLSYQIARYESLDTLDSLARDRLGMEPLRNYQFLEVPRPAQDDLPPPPVEQHPRLSLRARIVAALLGRAQAPDARDASAGKGQP